MQAHIFHTFNYGAQFEYKYTTPPPCPYCTGLHEFSFTAGRQPGSFYIMWAIIDDVTLSHTSLCIDYSQDYGQTYTTYCYDVDSTFTGIKRLTSFEKDLLKQNYPNPFNETTRIGFFLKEPAFVDLIVSDIYGNIVKRCFSGRCPRGENGVTWNGISEQGNRVSPGVYIYSLKVNGVTAGIKKAIIY
jgi:hypothetical protein